MVSPCRFQLPAFQAMSLVQWSEKAQAIVGHIMVHYSCSMWHSQHIFSDGFPMLIPAACIPSNVPGSVIRGSTGHCGHIMVHYSCSMWHSPHIFSDGLPMLIPAACIPSNVPGSVIRGSTGHCGAHNGTLFMFYVALSTYLWWGSPHVDSSCLHSKQCPWFSDQRKHRPLWGT